MNCLERVQRIMVSVIPGLSRATNREKLDELNVDTLKDRRVRQDLFYANRIISGKGKANPPSIFKIHGK